MSNRLATILLFVFSILIIIAVCYFSYGEATNNTVTINGSTIPLCTNKFTVNSINGFEILKADSPEKFALVLDNLDQVFRSQEQDLPWNGYEHEKYFVLSTTKIPSGKTNAKLVQGNYVYFVLHSLSDDNISVSYNDPDILTIVFTIVLYLIAAFIIWALIVGVLALSVNDKKEWELTRLKRWFYYRN